MGNHQQERQPRQQCQLGDQQGRQLRQPNLPLYYQFKLALSDPREPSEPEPSGPSGPKEPENGDEHPVEEPQGPSGPGPEALVA